MARIVQFSRAGGPDVLEIVEVTDGAPRRDEVRITVKAIGLNRAESMWRQDAYVEPVRSFPARLGYELGGIVEAVGPDVHGVAVGDAVNTLAAFSFNDYGSYGDRVVMPAEVVIAQPKTFSFVEGASVWEMFLTAHGMLVERAGIGGGDVVLISAASSSVGLAAIQIARARGAEPVALTRTGAKRQRLLEAGASHVIATAEDDVVGAIRRITDGAGARVAVDPVGGTVAATLFDALAPGGTLIVYGDLSGAPIPIPALALVSRRITVEGFSLTPSRGHPGHLSAATIETVRGGFEDGSLTPVIDRVFPFERIVDAHRRLDSNEQFGKIVVSVADANDGRR